jgi:hypothetical protein
LKTEIIIIINPSIHLQPLSQSTSLHIPRVSKHLLLLLFDSSFASNTVSPLIQIVRANPFSRGRWAIKLSTTAHLPLSTHVNNTDTAPTNLTLVYHLFPLLPHICSLEY